MPAAPPTFSMFTGWPQAAVSLAPIRRAARSIAPPGVAGTMIVIGLLGKAACAKATGVGERGGQSDEVSACAWGFLVER